MTLFGVSVLGIAGAVRASASPRSLVLRAVAVAGLGRGALNYIPWSVYNYMPDVDEIVTGRRREGAFAGVMTFVRKLMQSLAIFVVSQILHFSGLIPKSMHAARSVVNAVLLIMGFGVLARARVRLRRLAALQAQ